MVSWDRYTAMKSSPSHASHSASSAARILQVTQSAYPILLLIVFLVTLTVHGIRAGSKSKAKATNTGHAESNGGVLKNIENANQHDMDPTRAQKALFLWLSVILTTTFIGDAVNIIVHALMQRPWWCGEAPVVSHHYERLGLPELKSCLDIYCRFFLRLYLHPYLPHRCQVCAIAGAPFHLACRFLPRSGPSCGIDCALFVRHSRTCIYTQTFQERTGQV